MKKDKKILPHKFFNRPVIIVAKDLIGKILARTINGKTERFLIAETEAYDGPEDLACHASKGRTKRTEVMFGKARVWYIYIIYGMYHMINIVTGEKEYPAAVLIRGAIDIKTGERISGPGKLARQLNIDRTFTGKEAGPENLFWIEEDKVLEKKLNLSKKKIVVTPRIGIDYAGPIWAAKPYRFVLSE
jgi:DNA-3-methyladenine glycosylase